MLPQLREIERRFADSVIVVGVHSGKYHAERVTARIRDATQRLGLTHPVVNDRQFRVWRSFAVRAWPTLVIVDPLGKVQGMHAGEYNADALERFLRRLIASLDTDAIDRRPRSFASHEPVVTSTLLRYPGKVAVDGDRIAIADSGHHRVLVGRFDDDGHRVIVERTFGTGVAGFEDGSPGRLDMPQGVVLDEERVYIADAENHAIRVGSMIDRSLRTIAGTGQQRRSQEDAKAGALSSPWDLTRVGPRLFIALAGTHQIGSVDLSSRATRLHSGTGAEELFDGPHGHAALAQPMGLVAAPPRLYFVDAESNAVRWADVDARGGVGTVIGTGLFDFGDVDGAADAVRLQHPQGIALHRSGGLLIADTYNDAIKWVSPLTRSAETWIRGLSEPTGIAVGRTRLYVADTNAHRIVAVDFVSGTMETVQIDGAD